MAVIHTKTKGGLVAVVIILILLATLPLINTIGFGGFIAVVFIAAIIFIPIVIALNGGGSITAHQRYKKAIQNSSGIEKARLIIRDKSTTIMLRLKRNENDYSLSSVIMATSMSYIRTADIFYGLLREDYESLGKGEIFNTLSEALVSNEEKELIVSSRLFGIVLGIVIEKSADITNKAINKTTIKNYINSCTLDEIYKTELIKAMVAYWNLENKSIKTTQRMLEDLTYLLFDSKIKRSKDDLPNPMTTASIAEAIKYARENTQINDLVIKELTEQKMIIASPTRSKKTKKLEMNNENFRKSYSDDFK